MEMWKINSYLKELKRLDQELKEQEESIELEINRLKNWLDNERDRIAKEKEFYERIETACREGIALLQLREKDSSTAELLERGRKIKEIAGHYSTPFVIDDRVDIALAVGADGVHVGADDMPVAIARRLLGPGKIVGATAKTVEWLQQPFGGEENA